MDINIVGTAFWTFVAIVSVAGIVGDYQRRKLMLEPLRLAIEKGQPLDPKVVEQLMRREQSDNQTQPEHLRIAGVITLASGVGVAIAGALMAQLQPRLLYFALALGAIAACVGIGLIVAGNLLARHRTARAIDGREPNRDGDR